MKKLGLIIFIAAITAGVILANVFSWGKLSIKMPNISFGSKVHGSGNVVTEKRNISDFDSVEVSGVFIVEIVAQKEFSIEVEADDNLLPLIKTVVNGGTLQLGTEKRFSTHNRIKVRISAPNIKSLDVSGASSTILTNLDNESLSIDTGGASEVKVSGKTGRLTIEMGGASRIDAESLSASDATVDGGGASSASVTVSGELSADLGGASRVNYSGNPKNVEKKTSGGASVRQRD